MYFIFPQRALELQYHRLTPKTENTPGSGVGSAGGFSPRWGFTCSKRRIWLRLAGFSRVLSGNCFREVLTASKMGGQNGPNAQMACFAFEYFELENLRARAAQRANSTAEPAYRAASKLMTVTFDVRDHVVAASWCGPDRHHLRRAASPTPHFKRRGRASVELDGTRSCSCCEVRLSALTRR